MANKFYVKIINSVQNQTNVIKNVKDNLDKLDRREIVYKVNCSQCPISYIGQSKWNLRTRLQEHRRNILAPKEKQNSLAIHTNNLTHTFNFNNAQILVTEPNYFSRLILESLHIKINNTVNSKIESNQFTPMYNNLLYDLKKWHPC